MQILNREMTARLYVTKNTKITELVNCIFKEEIVFGEHNNIELRSFLFNICAQMCAAE